MGLLDKLRGIAANGAANLIEKAGAAVDGIITSQEERDTLKNEMAKIVNEHQEKMAEISLKETEATLKDMDSARNREIAIVTSDKAPLLNKVIQPILALIIVGATLIIWALILFRNYEPKTNEAMIIGSLTTLTGMTLSFYFGSSTGSAAKAKQIENMMK